MKREDSIVVVAFTAVAGCIGFGIIGLANWIGI